MFFVGQCQMLRRLAGGRLESLPAVVGLGRCLDRKEAEVLLRSLWASQHGSVAGDVDRLQPMYSTVTWPDGRIDGFEEGLTEEQARPVWDLVRQATLV